MSKGQPYLLSVFAVCGVIVTQWALCPTVQNSAWALPSFGDIVQAVGDTIQDTTGGAIPEEYLTVNGKIEYWDVYSSSYKPAKNVLVEINGYALDLIPMIDYAARVLTDTDGKYEWRHRRTIKDLGNLTLKIRASASTPDQLYNPFSDCLVRVFAPAEAIGYGPALYPYRRESLHSGSTPPNGSITIDMKIGGAQYSYGSSGYSGYGLICYANAFRIHQEILEHYKKLGEWGFSNHVLTDTDVVVPANFDNQYINEADIDNSRYNQVLGFIELALHNYDGTWSGLNPSTMDEDAPGVSEFMNTCRHEASHAVHSKMGPQPLNCIDAAQRHTMETQSNVITGYVEGLAEFLPLATMGAPGRLECIPTEPNYAGFGYQQLRIPTPAPTITDHHDWEGDVAALFWDLFDPANQEEFCRQVINRSANDDTEVPWDLRFKTKWTDRLADADLSRFRAVLAMTISGIWPVSSIDQFLERYRDLPGVDRHAFKAIAFNRCMGVPGTSETAASVEGQIVCRRQGPNMVKLEFTIVENEPEDRPYVSWQLFKESAGGSMTLVTSQTSGTWNGNRWATGTLITIPQPNGEEYYWLLVSDEMLPVPYRLRNPSFGELWATKRLSAIKGLRAILPASISGIQGGYGGSNGDIANAKAARTAYKSVRAEMLAYIARQEGAIEQQRVLYYLAKFAGGVNLPDKIPAELMEVTVTAGRVEEKPTAAARDFKRWLSETAKGKLPLNSIKVSVRQLLNRYAKESDKLIAEQKDAKLRVKTLSQRLNDACAKLKFGSQKSYENASLMSQVDYSQRLLSLLDKDAQLQPAMELNLAAIRTLAAGK